MRAAPPIRTEADAPVSPRLARFIWFSPFVILFGFWIFLTIPATQDFTIKLLQENWPVEMLTFLCAIAAGLLGLRLAARARRDNETALTWGFYVLFSFGIIFLAGEEVAWGQEFYFYDTPDFWLQRNAQGQMTFHNFVEWQGRNHWLRLLFGCGGLFATFLSGSRTFEAINAHPILRPWFGLIVFQSLVEAYCKNIPVNEMTSYIVRKESEVVEMMVSISGLLYIWIQSRRHSAGGRVSSGPRHLP